MQFISSFLVRTDSTAKILYRGEYIEQVDNYPSLGNNRMHLSTGVNFQYSNPSIFAELRRSVGMSLYFCVDFLTCRSKAFVQEDLLWVGKIEKSVVSAEKVLLCVTGSEATFNAIRLARAATGRKPCGVGSSSATTSRTRR